MYSDVIAELLRTIKATNFDVWTSVCTGAKALFFYQIYAAIISVQI